MALAYFQESSCRICCSACDSLQLNVTANSTTTSHPGASELLSPSTCRLIFIVFAAIVLLEFLARRIQSTVCFREVSRFYAVAQGWYECCWRRCFLPWFRTLLTPVLALLIVGSLIAFVVVGVRFVHNNAMQVSAVLCLVYSIVQVMGCLLPIFRLLGLLLVATIFEFFFRFQCIGSFVLASWRKEGQIDEGKHHSRFADLRVDVELEGGGEASVHVIPCIKDNYAYLVVDRQSLAACVVDPADAKAVKRALWAIEKLHYGGVELNLDTILTTHWHWDHQAGNLELQQILKRDLRVYGGEGDGVLGCTDEVAHKDTFSIGALTWEVLAMPGHTRGSVAYRLRGRSGQDCLMTGDALFCAGGCGAPFEACRGELERNLVMILRECGGSTLMFPGHEYTQRLLSMLEPKAGTPAYSLAVVGAKEMAEHRRGHKKHEDRLPTIPMRLSEERCFQLCGPMSGGRLLEHVHKLVAVLQHPCKECEEEGESGSEAEDCEEDADGEGDMEGGGVSQALVGEYASPTIFRHDDSSFCSPFVCLFRCDFEHICAILESQQAAAVPYGDAVQLLRKSPLDILSEVDIELMRVLDATHENLPDVREVEQALLVLGVDHDESIGRESCNNLGELCIDTKCLEKSLAAILGVVHASELMAACENWALPVREVAWQLHDAAREARGEHSFFAGICKQCCSCCRNLFKSGKKKAFVDSDEDLDSAALPLLRPPVHDLCACRFCSSGVVNRRRPQIHE